ncbi:fungal-specific transcription factor domain-domain-containing protein [Protomyces lactucae-debilis]|uniref:Fungal-specific transcription factor domain-domain-containing protein n=1 Tax=Protomyces lactucae-debilis TaxID=2754530 RepID=A0A1Y2FTJ1_PROLT|nr:fungal-specific transcription factor domain-containing protein [Protomyces lactucae-debilis]ORY86897.1 fungal-specific transcription factor domain-domain-containing protein [Protomyces lactucae-debilis]
MKSGKPICNNCFKRGTDSECSYKAIRRSGPFTPGDARHVDDAGPIGSPGQLLSYYFAHVADVFSIFHGKDNPFAMKLRELVQDSPPLTFVIQCMSAFIMSAKDPSLHDMLAKGLALQQQSFLALQDALGQEDHAQSDATFASVILLGLSESWEVQRKNSSGLHHLFAAKQLLIERYAQIDKMPPPATYLTSMLLYWDTLVCVHNDTRYDSRYLAALQQAYSQAHLQPLDSIIGINYTLFLIIQDVLQLTRQTDVSIEQIHQQCRALAGWEQTLSPQQLSQVEGKLGPTCKLEHVLLCGEVWRQATLVLIHRHWAPMLGTTDEALTEMASAGLQLLRSIPDASSVCVRDMFPLAVLAPDIKDYTDRAFITSRYQALYEAIKIAYIKDISDYLTELWQSIDTRAHRSKEWLQLMADRSFTPLLG